MMKMVLADDHIMLRDGLRVILGGDSDIEIVGEAADGQEAVDLACKRRPDVVLMDVTMPNLNGVEATRAIRKLAPATKILGVSMHSEREYVLAMLQAGASGYLVKSSAGTEVLRAVHTVMEGHTYFCPVAADAIRRGLTTVAARQTVGPRVTPREEEVLRLLAEGKTTKQAAAILRISGKTVEMHRQRLMKKLGFASVAELVRYAIREGIVLA